MNTENSGNLFLLISDCFAHHNYETKKSRQKYFAGFMLFEVKLFVDLFFSRG